MSIQSDSPVHLADRQLEAYNRGDLDGFCDCYSPDVCVLAEDGTPVFRGMEEFRRRYAALFGDFRDVRARVERRLALGRHVIDLEHWERTSRESGDRVTGTLLVRYTERDGRIAVVEFLR